MFWGTKLILLLWGLHGLCLIKNLTPSWASPVRKKYELW
jgi:hypothetical protein